MKSLVTAILLRFTFLCCSIGSGKDNVAIPVQNNGNGNNNIAATKMKITIGTAVFAATLYDNSSATALKAMLPFTINMTELNGNEKYYDIPNSLPTNSLARGDVKAGDLMLYGNNTLVLFIKISAPHTAIQSLDTLTIQPDLQPLWAMETWW